jgi:hypothetical protein
MIVIGAVIALLRMDLRDAPSRFSKTTASTSGTDAGDGESRRSAGRPGESANAFVEHGDDPTLVGNSYEVTRTCYRYKRLEAFYTAKSKDPNSPLSRPEEFAKLPPEQQVYAHKVVAFLKQQSAACAPWASSTPQADANTQMYSTARAAALRGNDDAAACYVAAAWQSPDENEPGYEAFANDYARDVPRLISEALASGSWEVVIAAAGNLDEQHGLRTRSGLTSSNKYLVARLSQLGAADSDAAAQFGSSAASQARSISPAQLVELDRLAARLYTEKFGRSQYGSQDILDKCVN